MNKHTRERHAARTPASPMFLHPEEASIAAEVATRAAVPPSIVVEGVDQQGARLVETMTVRPVPWWNNIRRAWMVTGPGGQPVLVDPQPPPPVFGTSISFPDVPPAVKVAL